MTNRECIIQCEGKLKKDTFKDNVYHFIFNDKDINSYSYTVRFMLNTLSDLNTSINIDDFDSLTIEYNDYRKYKEVKL